MRSTTANRRVRTAIPFAPRATTRDEQVSQSVKRALAGSGCAPLRRVRVDVHEGLVVLKGRVTRFYHKQLAQEAAKRVRGVDTVHNEIAVNR